MVEMIFTPHLFDLSYGELVKLSEFSSEKYRIQQISRWIVDRHPQSFSEIKNIPISQREKFSNKFALSKLKIHSRQISKIDQTEKFTFETKDKRFISSVFLPHIKYNSICISSQIGCAFECTYCATGLIPFRRNLSSGEILDQILLTEEKIKQKIKNVLFMGMGEPLANYENVLKAIEWLISDNGFKLHPHKVTLSTTGIPSQILRLANQQLNINLALSLHAPNDKIRKKIMPTSAQFLIKEILTACKHFQKKNNSNFTIEYILIKDMNDNIKEIRELLVLIRSFNFSPLPKINLIPYNQVLTLKYKKIDPKQVEFFFRFLKNNGFNVHTRKAQGEDIVAACGQLS